MTQEPKAPSAHAGPQPKIGPFAQLIFGSRWLQLPLYVGLIVAQGVYVLLFLKELWHLVRALVRASEQQIMLVVLGLIDVVMISNLLVMVIVGGYETFVSRLEPERPSGPAGMAEPRQCQRAEDQARDGDHRHLLDLTASATFIEAGNLGTTRSNFTESGVMWQVLIHLTFIISAIGIAWVDRISESGHRRGSRLRGDPPSQAPMARCNGRRPRASVSDGASPKASL